ncbi:MAG: flagellar hook-basal body complex protein FliE [Candidatus Sericytochromatia bacterium]|nr:flagellar hook-basal body complex protein FliE [Candidatus Sericytochromatia bacterium]
MRMDPLGPRPAGGAFGAFPTFADFPALPKTPSLDEGMASVTDPAMDSGDDGPGAHFAAILNDAIDAVNAQQVRAEEVTMDFALGRSVDPHAVMIENAKAETLVHLTSSVTNKMAQSFQTLMNLQI